MNVIKEGDHITVAYGEHEVRCQVEVVYCPVGQLPKYYVVPLHDWIGPKHIVDTKKRTTYRLGSEHLGSPKINYKSMWVDLLNK